MRISRRKISVCARTDPVTRLPMRRPNASGSEFRRNIPARPGVSGAGRGYVVATGATYTV